MKKMKTALLTVIAVLLVIAGMVASLMKGVDFTQAQWETLKILGIVCGASAFYCFVVGQISGNTSQMDKLWSILPIAYTWIVAVRGGMKPRLIIMAVIATMWGIRLTYNFALKGAYSIKFWEGEEDYRWAILRKNKILGNKVVWLLFNLLFISIYQNALVLATCLPAVACMESTTAIGVLDIVACIVSCGFLILETVADKQQWAFQSKKHALLRKNPKLAELPAPYNKGFNTTGLWGHSRHPNYLGEQGIWCGIYLFTIEAGVTHWGVFHPTMVGCLLLILLFMGSSILGETISKSKYPEYEDYQESVWKYIPGPKYKG